MDSSPLMSTSHTTRKRPRVTDDPEVGKVLRTLRDSSSSSVVSTASDLLLIESSKVMTLCGAAGMTLTLSQVETVKMKISSSLISSHVTHWSQCPPLLDASCETSRKVYLGYPELNSILPSIPHPAVIELVDDGNSNAVNITPQMNHFVGMMLAISSAAEGSHVLLLDTGNGTEIEQMLMQQCSSFFHRQSNRSDTFMEELLQRIQVERCYDPFLLVEVLSSILGLPLSLQPDIVIVFDWVKATMPIMTIKDMSMHKRQMGGDRHAHRKESSAMSSGVSSQPLVAEIALSLQKLTVPRTERGDEDPADSLRTTNKTAVRKSTSVVILNARCFGTSSPFDHVLSDIADISLLLKSVPSPDVVGDVMRQGAAELLKKPDLSGMNNSNKTCMFQF